MPFVHSPRTFWALLVVAVTLPGAAILARRAASDEPVAVVVSAPADETETPVDFATQIAPILSRNCYACHGPDEESRKAELRLDDRDSTIDESFAIEPGSSEDSEVFLRIISDDIKERMPPGDSGHTLTEEEVNLIARWIDEGAEYSLHWSFVAPARPELPMVRQPQWCSNEIDYFVLQRLETAGLGPSVEADRYTLIRRASLDLTGLPPTPAEVEAFINNARPDAYEQLIDRLLASPAYGERWARVWLDLARYADSKGHGSDPLRENIWPYRDWLIQALNANMPFDQFTTEQLAGDLLPEPTTDQILATAFHRNTMNNTEGGTDDEEFRVAAVKDRAITTVQVWMGLTMGCAQCHSHKYDPITHNEFYQFYAFFNQTADRDTNNDAPLREVPTPFSRLLQEEIKQLDAELAALPADSDTRQSVEARLADLRSQLEKVGTTTNTPVMVELGTDQQRQSFLMVKGNFLDPGDPVEPFTPAAFHPMPEGAPANRLGVAQWLMSPENPLTARVAANRMWANLFGLGIVETEEDFGTQGTLPSHPQLLDWMAVEFRENGWNTKAMLRTIMLSSAYKQSSHMTPELIEADPRNLLISRGPRFRLEAETVRDQALALSGLLSDKIYGPSVYPPQPPGLWRAAFNGQRNWPTSTGEDRYRRGLYTFLRRTTPYPSLAAFDAPSRETCTLRRIRTNTPIQVFVTLNDPCYVEMSQAYARRVLREGGANNEERMRYALELAICRPATDREMATMLSLLESELLHYQQHVEEATKLATDPLGPLPEGMSAAEAAAWTVVTNVILNLDAVMTKG